MRYLGWLSWMLANTASSCLSFASSATLTATWMYRMRPSPFLVVVSAYKRHISILLGRWPKLYHIFLREIENLLKKQEMFSVVKAPVLTYWASFPWKRDNSTIFRHCLSMLTSNYVEIWLPKLLDFYFQFHQRDGDIRSKNHISHTNSILFSV